MLSRCTTILALAGSTAAFSPMMSMETGRREILQAGAALSLSAPLLRPDKANAAWSGPNFGSRHGTAPIITIFDHRGCQRGGENKEYSGAKANGQEDEMMVKVAVGPVQKWDAGGFIAENIPFLFPARK